MSSYNLKLGLLTLNSPAIKGVGPAFIKKHIVHSDYFSSDDIVLKISQLLSENKKHISDEVIFDTCERSRETISLCADENIKIITCYDDSYPLNLSEIKDAPSVIFTKGNLELFNTKTVCIIGTREPNLNGIRIAQRVAEHYKIKRWNICNGLAEGIDQAAIQSNELFYSNVIGIVAGGLNYNSEKTLLKKTCYNAERVLDAGGLIISEFPPGKKEDAFTVVKSCRIQGGVSDGLILIQSGINGGSRYTLKSFCETSRPIAVIDPLKEDEESPSFSANIMIRDQKNKGLSIITELKTEKIFTKDIVLLRSKDDYKNLDNLISDGERSHEETNKMLFD